MMFDPDKNDASDRDRELFLGHLVTWGSIIIGLGLAIALAPVFAADQDPGDSIARPVAASANGKSVED